MKIDYKNTENQFETKENITLITILKKNGTSLTAKIDASDLEKVKAVGNWFAEWNKDFNSYTVQNISNNKLNKKKKPLKQSLESIILDVSPNAPIKHINGDKLDNRKCNLEVFKQEGKNEIEKIDNDTIAVLLKDKYGNVTSRALISSKDLDTVITDKYTWVNHKVHSQNSVVANTTEGRIHLDKLLMNPAENQKIHHINLNPLDNTRKNLELVTIEK